ncbi:MAG: ABC transporter ATP-binding protein [Chitinophagaceae bacterium]
MQPVIEVQGLSKHFGTFQAVNDISFTVFKGDVYGFLGQNGAGKSTTLRMMLSLITPTSGTINVVGQSLSENRTGALRQMGAVIEKPDVYKYLSAYDNLKLFARLSGIKPTQQQLMQQLEMVGLAERAKDVVKTFSQGMKQRLGIAIALIHEPSIVILDEPTNGLDPQGIADIRNLILRLSREMYKTVVVSSHLLSEIEQVATRVLIIDKGKKLVEGDATTLFDPAQAIVEFTCDNPHAALNVLQQSQWQQYLQPQRQSHIVLKIHRNQIPALNVFLVQSNIAVYSLQPKHSLEDYFLQVTSGAQHVATYQY